MDGWIRLHTNLPHHRDAVLRVLKPAHKSRDVAQHIRQWTAEELELAIVNEGGAAAAMRTREEWINHPQGRAVAAEPLLQQNISKRLLSWPATREKPLYGLKVLDLTRVLAGPVATRTLAGFGAQVLRVDPMNWEEGIVIPEVTLGKRCCRLQLDNKSDRERFESLLSEAHVFVHGYRPGAGRTRLQHATYQ